MPDPHNHNWIQEQLARELSPVCAPGTLWGRIESARRRNRHSPRAGWMLWPAIAMLLLFASGDLAWEIGKARGSLAPLTARDVESANCDLRSSDPVEVARWVKARTNVEIGLSCGRAGGAQLRGARLIRKRGASYAAIAYQVGNDAATLLVSGNRSLFGWNREYAVAWSGSKENPEACSHCHIDARNQL